MRQERKVLAVDDNQLNLQIIQEALDEEYDLRVATTGKEALQIAVDFSPDLFLIDVMMPEMDGYAVCRNLRTNAAFTNTPIIMVTAKDSLSDKVRGREAGADDYITKPFEEDELRESLEFFFETHAVSHCRL